MFDFSWGEVLVIGAVALVVIGPKELPGVLRTVGQALGKIRRMAGEFQGQFQEAMREAELHEARKSIEGIQDSVASSFNPIQTIRDEIKGATETKPEDGSRDVPITLPELPPVPDLTPDQIQAAFAPGPAEVAAAAVADSPAPLAAPEPESEAPAVEEPPAKPKPRRKPAKPKDTA
jgi:sec-independent protein translocase protein TatB